MDIRTSPCRSCQSPMIWGTNVATGKSIPLDANPEAQGKTRYRIVKSSYPIQIEKVTEPTEEPTYVSHFETCPNAKQHSKKSSEVGK